MIYPIRTLKSLPDYHYEGHFFQRGVSENGKPGGNDVEKSFLQLFSEIITHFPD
jgi:hypothetical protein